MNRLSLAPLWLLTLLAGCAAFSAPKTAAPDGATVTAAAGAVVDSLPAAVAWPTALGGLALVGAGIFVWIALGNRRRAVLMILAGFCFAVLPSIVLELAARLMWPVVALTTLAGVGGVALCAKWAYDKWIEAPE